MTAKHTIRQYLEFQQAYDYFNATLWNSTLPQLLVTLQRRPRMMGHFAPERHQHRTEAEIIHEIALNPDYFVGQTDEQILDTLVHEMAHVWQQTYGKPGRRGYHNNEWGAEMKRIGLYQFYGVSAAFERLQVRYPGSSVFRLPVPDLGRRVSL